MKTQIKIIVVTFTFALMLGCAHSLPYRDLNPEKAKTEGYFVKQDEAKARGGIAGYVPRYCSDGGWGMPSKNCEGAPAQASTASAAITSVVAKVVDSDGDGVADNKDQCPGTPNGVKVNAFGCPLDHKVEIKLDAQFLSGSAKLNTQDAKELDSIAEILASNPNIHMRIEGHTDSSGVAEKNLKLSEARAKAVVAYLISKGAKATQLEAQGFGSQKPVADNKTAAGRLANRRVTGVVTKQ